MVSIETLLIIIYWFFKNIHSRALFSIAFRETGRLREKHWYEREAATVCLLYVPSPGIAYPWSRDWTYSLGMWTDQKLNPQPLSYGIMLQPIVPQWPEIHTDFYILFLLLKYFISTNSLWVESLGFCEYKIMLSSNKNNLPTSFLNLDVLNLFYLPNTSG